MIWGIHRLDQNWSGDQSAKECKLKGLICYFFYRRSKSQDYVT